MTVIIITVVVVTVVAFLLFTAGNFFYNMILMPGVFAKFVKKRKGAIDLGINAAPVPDVSGEWWDGMPVETVRMTSRDGYDLQGYYLENGGGSKRIAVLIHGYYGKAREMAVYACIYHEMGFSVFAADNRAHGSSGGKAIGMGWLDRLDYLDWIKLLIERNGSGTEIIIHGHSMGGATACMLSGEELPPNVKGIISDCAYDSVKNVLTWQLKNMFKLPAFPLLPITSLICRVRAGYFIGSGNSAAAVAKCKIPIIFIHGGQDSVVPFSMVDSLYDAANPELRDKWMVMGAKHIESVSVDADGYAERVKEFANRVVNG